MAELLSFVAGRVVRGAVPAFVVGLWVRELWRNR